MKRLLFYIAFAVSAIALGAHTAPADTLPVIRQIKDAGNISVSMPQGLAERLAQVSDTETTESREVRDENASAVKALSRVGYRIQVFDDNNVRTAKHDAENRKRQMESRFPEFRVYLQFNSPYWRVKVGDFRTRSEAEAALAAIKASFPTIAPQIRVVRDHININ